MEQSIEQTKNRDFLLRVTDEGSLPEIVQYGPSSRFKCFTASKGTNTYFYFKCGCFKLTPNLSEMYTPGRWCGLLVNCLISIVYRICIAAYWILYSEFGLVSVSILFSTSAMVNLDVK